LGDQAAVAVQDRGGVAVAVSVDPDEHPIAVGCSQSGHTIGWRRGGSSGRTPVAGNE
jgi:hypothetical protein